MSEQLPPPNTQLLVSGSGAIYMQNLAVRGNSIIATNTDGSVNFVPNGDGVIGFGDVGFSNGVISTTLTDLDIVLAPNGNGNVGVGTTSPAAKLDIGGNTDGQVQAILTRSVDTDFQLQAINESSSNNSGDVVSKFGLRHGTNDTALFNFIRGNLGNDGSLAIVTDNAERMRIDNVGNVGIGTSNPAAKLDVSGLIKTDHLSLGIHQYPNVGGQWLTINLNTYNANAGPNAPDPEGGIMFSNIASNSIFQWGYYMGVVKPSASDQSNSQRLDIGRTNNVESQISGGTTAPPGTFIPSVTVFNDNVGIGTSSPRTRFQVNSPVDSFYSNTSGQAVEIYGSASETPPVYSVVGSTATVMINSTDAYSQNVGASISLGGRSYPWGLPQNPDEQHTVYTRISGVQQPNTDQYFGNFVVETLYNNTGGLREAFRIDGYGNVGIGTSSPTSRLTINSGSTSNASAENGYHGFSVTTGTNYQTIWMGYDGSADIGYINCAKSGSMQPICLQTRGSTVAIGTASPSVGKLQVSGYLGGSVPRGYYTEYNGSGGVSTSYYGGSGFAYSIYCSNAIGANGIGWTSDERIKTEISVVDDAWALQKVRDIECKEYHYKDPMLRKEQKTIGYIAQDIKQHLPQAVSTIEEYVPDEMRPIENITWTPTEGGFKVIIPSLTFSTEHTRKLLFYVTLGGEGEEEPEQRVELTADEENAVIFEKRYSRVFLYGKKVNNFLQIAKDKIYSLHHSAIQEIDRRQVADNERILELEGELALMKEENNLLKQQLDSILGRLSAAGL